MKFAEIINTVSKKHPIVSNAQLLLILVAVIFISSCSPKIPFTQALKDQYKLTPEELQHIQFYLSDPVILRRGSDEGNKKSTDQGTLIVNSEKEIQQITFKASTPGVVSEVLAPNLMSVSFEEGPNKFLVFGSGTSKDGYYRLQALSWQNGRGKINYNDKLYYSEQGSDNAILFFRMKSLKNLKFDEKVVKGKKVN